MSLRKKESVVVLRLCVVFFLALLLSLIGTNASTQQKKTAPMFHEVQEIFLSNCVMCHSGPKAPRELQLTGFELVMKGSQNGAVVVPGDPQSSEIVKRIRGLRVPRMPFGGPPWLSEDDMRLIEEWIAEGAKGPEPSPLEPTTVQADAPRAALSFADVRPIFKMRCERCHAERGLMGPAPEGFFVTTYESLLDSRNRARIVPGSAAASELVRRIRGQAVPRMPFDGPPYLSDEEIALIARWIEEGAVDERGREAPLPVGARVRLHGTLTPAGTLDGLPLHLRRGMDTRKGVFPGEYVEVRGRVNADGTIDIERIRKR